MDKNAIEPFKSQYIKLVKDTGESLDGTIIQILEDSVIFQTELRRFALSMDSIVNIIPHEKTKKIRSEQKS
jgi:hypothetical protein